MAHPGPVNWFLRVVEIPEQRWQCRWGGDVFDEHSTLQDALDHIEVLAAEHQPARIFVHKRRPRRGARGGSADPPQLADGLRRPALTVALTHDNVTAGSASP